jgi:plastocyanin
MATLWLLGHAAAVRADATVEGHVTLPKAITSPVMNKRYEVITSGGVLSPNPPRAVVYLEGAPTLSAQPETRQVVQTNFAFVPSLLPIQVGTRVEFPNFDPTFHNVFSYSPPKRFDLGRYRPDERPIPSQLFDKPGLVTLRCDIHEHMRGLILVLESPYFVLSDTDGRFRLDHVPAGRFTLKAWINSKTTLEKTVEIPASGTIQVEFP